MDAFLRKDEARASVRRSRVVPTPRCRCQARKIMAGDGDYKARYAEESAV